MSAISVRLPDSLHEKVRELAAQDNVTINQFVALALAEKVASMTTETYLNQRAERASRSRFEDALKQVPDIAPDEQDKL